MTMTLCEDWRFLPGIPTGFGVDPLFLSPADLSGFAAIEAEAVCHLIAIPQGAERAPAKLWAKTNQMLHSGGALYAGFAGRGRWLWGKRPASPAITPRKIRRQLRQAGYQNATIYAALPDHLCPIYLVPLQPALLRFVLSRYPGGKYALVRHAWFRQAVSRWGMSLLPGYAVVAIKQDA